MLSLLSVLQMGAQKTIDLSGDWNFEIDRQDIGEKEKWFNQALKDMIELPGSMPERLKGDDVTVCTRWTGSLYDSSYYYNPYMEKYRREGNVKLPFFLTPDKHYVGVAWYQKEINLPKDWKKDRIVLFLERPHIESTVWVNGHKVGMQNSLCVAHVYDVTQFMSPGKCRIAIRIDNRIKDINVGPDSHSITDQTQGNWNGIVGRICLQTTPKVYLEDIQVYSEPEQKVARVKLLIKSSDKSTAIAQVKLSARSFNTEQRHVLPTVTHDVKVMNGIAEQEIVLPMGDDMLLWDEFNPALYKLTAEISTGKGKEVKEIQFGMRRFEIKGKVLDELREPVKDARVIVKELTSDGEPMGAYYTDTLYTQENGEFRFLNEQAGGYGKYRLVCEDSPGIYKADSTDIKMEPTGGKGWYQGSDTKEVDFVLKKKNE